MQGRRRRCPVSPAGPDGIPRPGPDNLSVEVQAPGPEITDVGEQMLAVRHGGFGCVAVLPMTSDTGDRLLQFGSPKLLAGLQVHAMGKPQMLVIGSGTLDRPLVEPAFRHIGHAGRTCRSEKDPVAPHERR